MIPTVADRPARADKARKHKRYVQFHAGLDVVEYCHLARARGMKIVRATRPGMHVYCELTLYGTRSQMAATEEDWAARGAWEIYRRRPTGAFEAADGSDDPDEWDEAEVDWADLLARRPPPPRKPTIEEELTALRRLARRGPARMPADLRAARDIVLRLVPPGSLDECRTWIHLPLLARVQSGRWPSPRVRDRAEREALRAAQDLLAPLADSVACRRKSVRWSNPGYCPDAFYGGYLWRFHVEMVQAIAWGHREFVEGFRFGRRPRKPHRDANPYSDRWRSMSWDRGYILGLKGPRDLAEWVAARTPCQEQP